MLKGRRGFRMGFAVFLTAVIISCTATSIPVMANELELSVDETLEEKLEAEECVKEDSSADTGFVIGDEAVESDNTDELIALDATVDYDGECLSNVKIQEGNNGTKLYLTYNYERGYVYSVYLMGFQNDGSEREEIFVDYDPICPEDEFGVRQATTNNGTSRVDITGKVIEWTNDGYVYAVVRAVEPENAGSIRDLSVGVISPRSNMYHYQTPEDQELHLNRIEFDSTSGVLRCNYPQSYNDDVYEITAKTRPMYYVKDQESGWNVLTSIKMGLLPANTGVGLNLWENKKYEGDKFEEIIIAVELASNNLKYASGTEWYVFGSMVNAENSEFELKNDGCVHVKSNTMKTEYLQSVIVLYSVDEYGSTYQICKKQSKSFSNSNGELILACFANEIVNNGSGDYYAVIIPCGASYIEDDVVLSRTNTFTYTKPSEDKYLTVPAITIYSGNEYGKEFSWNEVDNASFYCYGITQGKRLVYGEFLGTRGGIKRINYEANGLMGNVTIAVTAFPADLNNNHPSNSSMNNDLIPELVTNDVAHIGNNGMPYVNYQHTGDAEMVLMLYCKNSSGTRVVKQGYVDEDEEWTKAIINNGAGEYYYDIYYFTDSGIDKILRTPSFTYTFPKSKLSEPIVSITNEDNKVVKFSWSEVEGAEYYETPYLNGTRDWEGRSFTTNIDDDCRSIHFRVRAIPSDITQKAPSEYADAICVFEHALYENIDLVYNKSIISGEEISVDAGDTINIKYYSDAFTGEKTLLSPKEIQNYHIQQDWYTFQSSIASVTNDGLVTALSPGKTTVGVLLTDAKGDTYEPRFELIVKDIPITAINLNESSIQLSTKSDGLELIASPVPSNATGYTFSWESSDPSIARVSNGIVTPVSSGEATITVKALDSTGKELAKSQCEVTVTDETIAVSGVTLNKSQLDMQEGDTEELTAFVDPITATNKNISWNSNNNQVASVDQNGKVTAGVPGTAIITVTTEDGEKTAICTVTVKEKVILKGVQLNETSITLSTKGDPVTLIATLYPEDVKDVTYEWTSSDPSIVTVKDGVLTPVAEGSARINVTAKDALNNTAKAMVDVTVIDETIKVTGVALNESFLRLKIGGNVKLKAIIEPAGALNQKVTWASDNNKAAIVDNEGLVTGVASGTARITVTTEDGNKTAVCRVTVSESGSGGDGSGRDPGLNALEEKVDKGVHYYDAYMVKGQTYVFPAKYGDIDASSTKKDQDIAWKTSDKKIASVSGKTKVKAANSTGSTSTVQIYDGATFASSEYVYRLHIVDPMIVEYGKTTLLKSITLAAGDDCTLAVAGLTGYEDKFNVTWLSSNNEIASVDNGIVSAVMKGSAKITAYVGGKAYNCTVKVDDTRTIPKKIEDESTITLSPLQTVSLKFSSTLFKAKNLEWISADGTLKPYNKNNTVAASTDKVSYFQNEVIRVTPAGKVTAVGVGSTTISATDQNGITQTVTITVPQPVSQTLSLNVNKTKQIKLYNVNASKANWSSSDSKITGNIVKGKIQGVRYGNAVVTCTYDPYNTGKGFEYKVNVNVENPRLNTKDASKWSKINKTQTTATLSLKTGTTYNLELLDVNQDVIFTSNKPVVAFVDEAGSISARSAGKAKITAKINGLTVTINVIVTN